MVLNSILAGVDQVPQLQGKTKTGGRLNVENSLQYLTQRFTDSHVGSQDAALIYPNPTLNTFVWYAGLVPKESLLLTIFDAHGKQLSQKRKSAEPFFETIDLSSFEPGFYWVQLAASSAVKTVKIAKQ